MEGSEEAEGEDSGEAGAEVEGSGEAEDEVEGSEGRAVGED